MIPRPIGLGARLAALHAASFGGIGIYVPFFPIWLESRGLPASWIGIVLALPIVVRVLVTAPLMTLADRSMGARRLIAAACLGVSVICLTLLAARDPVVVAVLVIFMAVAGADHPRRRSRHHPGDPPRAAPGLRAPPALGLDRLPDRQHRRRLSLGGSARRCGDLVPVLACDLCDGDRLGGRSRFRGGSCRCRRAATRIG